MSDYQSEIVDLRSDTVTRPTAEMYAAMATATVGDDVLGDDPTVTELEALAAKMLGKEAAVFVPSGTMGNQIAIAAQTEPGDVLILEEEAHVFFYEVGAPAILNSVMTRTVPSHLGIIDPADLKKAIMKRSLHTPGTKVVAIENTHNRAGGTIVPLDVIHEYRQICDENGLILHLDGARVFNAAVALQEPVSTVVRDFDTVSFCLSKGLRAPVGSVLVGSTETIERARIWRKRLGGGMRQAGLLAACGIVSLTQCVDRLAEDHARARNFATALDQVQGFTVDWKTVQTNMVIAQTEGPSEPVLQRLKSLGVWALPPSPDRIRFVFHADITDEKVAHAIRSVQSL